MKLSDGVVEQRMVNRPEKHRRARLPDVVPARVITRDLVNEAKSAGRRLKGEYRHQTKRKYGVTLTISFSGTPEIDQLIHTIAVADGLSRSAVIRQALLHYFLERECAGGA